MTETVWTRIIPTRAPPWWLAHALALGVVLITFVLRMALNGVIGGDRLPFVTFFPAVLIATALWGRWPGATALLVSGVLSAWAFVPPFFTLDVPDAHTFWFVVTFLVSAGVVWFAAAQLHDLVRKFRRKQALLEAEVAERERVTERLRTVAGEMEHRVRNLLALVQGLVMLPANHGDIDAFRNALVDRLQALARAQSLATGAPAGTLPLGQVLEQAIGPFGKDGDRFVLDGPQVEIGGDLALPLALALHELGTNAVKYGALSGSKGRVELTWGERPGRVHLEWKERDGAPVTPPAKAGFGSRLLGSALAAHAGEAKLDFEPDGVRYTASFAPMPVSA